MLWLSSLWCVRRAQRVVCPRHFRSVFVVHLILLPLWPSRETDQQWHQEIYHVDGQSQSPHGQIAAELNPTLHLEWSCRLLGILCT